MSNEKETQEQTNNQNALARIWKKIREGAAEFAALLTTPIIAIREALFPSQSSEENFEQAYAGDGRKETAGMDRKSETAKTRSETDPKHDGREAAEQQSDKDGLKITEAVVTHTDIRQGGEPIQNEDGTIGTETHPAVKGKFTIAGMEQLGSVPFTCFVNDGSVIVDPEYAEQIPAEMRERVETELKQKSAALYTEHLKQEVTKSVRDAGLNITFAGKPAQNKDGTYRMDMCPAVSGKFTVAGMEVPFTYFAKDDELTINPKYADRIPADVRKTVDPILKQEAAAEYSAYEEKLKQRERKENPYRMTDMELRHEAVRRDDGKGGTKLVYFPVVVGHCEIGDSDKKYVFAYNSRTDKSVIFDADAQEVLKTDNRLAEATKSIDEQVSARINEMNAQRQKMEQQKTQTQTVQNKQTVRNTPPKQQQQQRNTAARQTQRNTQGQTKYVKKNRQKSKGQDIDH